MDCNFNRYPCPEVPQIVVLVICPEGHIRENYLCVTHHSVYMTYLARGDINCGECLVRLSSEWLAERL